MKEKIFIYQLLPRLFGNKSEANIKNGSIQENGSGKFNDITSDLLEKLNKIKPVWVELGLQTIHEKTAQYIRRGYSLDIFDKAVSDLKKIGIEVIVHIILGLPFETKEMMYETVDYVGKCGIDGVKLQLLHILKGTDIAKNYENGEFKCLELNEYIEILENCIKILPKDVTIHRLTGDGAKKDLIAPIWSSDKKRVLNAVNTAFKNDNIVQGVI